MTNPQAARYPSLIAVLVLVALLLAGYLVLYAEWMLYCADYSPPHSGPARLCRAFPEAGTAFDLWMPLTPIVGLVLVARLRRQWLYATSGALFLLALALFILPLAVVN